MALNEHRIPKVLKHAWAWSFFRLAKQILYRRNAVIASSMRGLSCDAVLDIGAGEGYWLRAASVNKPCMAIEPNAASAEFLRETCRVPVYEDLTSSDWPRWMATYSNPAIWLFSVLQYVPEPKQLMSDLHAGAPAGAQIWMYQPIHQRQLLGVYARMFANWPSYESVQGRQFVWSWTELKSLIERSNWEIVEQKPAYGKWGILSHELWGIGVLAWGRPQWRLVAVLYMLLLLPVVWALNHCDARFTPRDIRRANGVWLRLKKAGA
jgi:hypothetical protein